jgi:arylsulfatase A-like enzyme
MRIPRVPALLLLACACAPSAEQGRPAVVDRPELSTSALVVQEERVTATVWEAREGTEDLRIDAESRREVAVDGAAALMLDGAGPKSLRIPLRPGRAFDVVRPRLLIRRVDALEVELWSGDERLHYAESPLVAGTALQAATIEVPLAIEAAQADALVLRVRGAGPVVYASVDLLEMPLEDRLPDVQRGAELIAIGDDLRRGVGLSSNTPLGFHLSDKHGAEIGFSYGVPQALRRGGEPPVLSVILSRPGHSERRHILPIERGDERTAWHWVRLPLGEHAGHELDVRFELESRSGAPELCAVSEPKVLTPGDTAPTVLLVTSDTHRADHLGAAGGRTRTPVLDALAARGVLMERCFATTNVTLPSHVAILTGRHPRDTGIMDNDSRLSDDAPTLAESFREAGWHTIAAVSAGHLAHEWSGLGQGFDRMLQTSRPDRRAGETITYLNRSLEELDGRPLFVWLHLFDAHTPYAPPKGAAEAYYEADPLAAQATARALPVERVPAHMPGIKDANWVVANYDGEASYLDGELARLLERPRMRTAIVAFTADHGESFGEHGVWWDHAELYPQTTRVPLILAWPGAPQGARRDELVLNNDLGRTLLDLADLRQARFPGRNLLAKEKRPEPIHLLSSHGTSAALVDWPWQVVLSLVDHHPDSQELSPRKARHSVELYDLQADPEALVDLAGHEVERARDLRGDLVDWLSRREALRWGRRNSRGSAMAATLQALGYAGTEAAPEHGSDAALIARDCDCVECRRWQDLVR